MYVLTCNFICIACISETIINIKTLDQLAKLKTEEKHPGIIHRFSCKDTVRRDTNTWHISEKWATGRENGKVSSRPPIMYRETTAKGEKCEK